MTLSRTTALRKTVDAAASATGSPVDGVVITGVQQAVADVRSVMLAPSDRDPVTGQSNLTTGLEALQAAVGRLAQLEHDWRLTPPLDAEQRARAQTDLEALRRELQRLEPVVRHGEEFWRGWARMLGLDTGYTASGVPGGLETTLASPRVTVEG